MGKMGIILGHNSPTNDLGYNSKPLSQNASMESTPATKVQNISTSCPISKTQRVY